MENLNLDTLDTLETLELDTLDLNDFDINDLSLNESMEEAYKNIIYSYPYYSDEDYDYEFRVTFMDDHLVLDEIKYNEHLDFDDCINLETNILNKHISELKDFINNDIDIRDGTTKLNNEVLLCVEKDSPSFDEALNENKKVVLRDLYVDLKEALII
jgi:hypothetical protein